MRNDPILAAFMASAFLLALAAPAAHGQSVQFFVDYSGPLEICDERVGERGPFSYSAHGVTDGVLPAPPLTCRSISLGPEDAPFDYELSCSRDETGTEGRTYCVRPQVSYGSPAGSQERYLFLSHPGLPGDVPAHEEGWSEEAVEVVLDVRFFCKDAVSPGPDCPGSDPDLAPTTSLALASVPLEDESCPLRTDVMQAFSREPADPADRVSRLRFWVRPPEDGTAELRIQARGDCYDPVLDREVPVSQTATIPLDLSGAEPCSTLPVRRVDLCAVPPPPLEVDFETLWEEEDFVCEAGRTDLVPALRHSRTTGAVASNPEGGRTASFQVCERTGQQQSCFVSLPVSDELRGVIFESSLFGAPAGRLPTLQWVRHYAVFDEDPTDLGAVKSFPGFYFGTLRLDPASNPESVDAFRFAEILLNGLDTDPPEGYRTDTDLHLPFDTGRISAQEDALGTFRQSSSMQVTEADLGEQFQMAVNDGEHQDARVELLAGSTRSQLVDFRIPTDFERRECKVRDLDYCLGRLTFEFTSDDGSPLRAPAGSAHSVFESGDPFRLDARSTGASTEAPIVSVPFHLPAENYTFDSFTVRKGSSLVDLSFETGPLQVPCGSDCCTGPDKPTVCLDDIEECVPGPVRVSGTADHPSGIAELRFQRKHPDDTVWDTAKVLFPGDPGVEPVGASPTRLRFDTAVDLPEGGEWLVRVEVVPLTGDDIRCLAGEVFNDAEATLDCYWKELAPIPGQPPEREREREIPTCLWLDEARAEGSICGGTRPLDDIESVATLVDGPLASRGPLEVGRGGAVYKGTFLTGTTEVVFTATDEFGRELTCTTTMRLSDQEDPQLTCPADRTVEADLPDSNGDGRCEAVVDFNVCASDPCDLGSRNATTQEVEPPTGSAFDLDRTPHIVSARAEDRSGNESTCEFTVQVVDTRPPVFGAAPPPLDRVLLSEEADDDGDGVPGDTDCRISWSRPVQAADLCTPDLELTASPAPFEMDETGPSTGNVAAAALTLGSYGGVVRALDEWGNDAWSSFAVEVVDDVPPTIECGSGDPDDPGSIISFVGEPPTHVRVHEFSATDNCEDPCCEARINGVPVEPGETYRVQPARFPSVERDEDGEPVAFLGTVFSGELACGCETHCATTLALPEAGTDCTIPFFRQEEPDPHAGSTLVLFNDTGAPASADVSVYATDGSLLTSAEVSGVPNDGNLLLPLDQGPLDLGLRPQEGVVGWIHVRADAFLEASLEIDSNGGSGVPEGTTIECGDTVFDTLAGAWFRTLRLGNAGNDNAKRRAMVAIVNRGAVPASVSVEAHGPEGSALGSWVTPAPVPAGGMVFFNTAVAGEGLVEGNLRISSAEELAAVQLTFGPDAGLGNEPPQPFTSIPKGEITFSEGTLRR